MSDSSSTTRTQLISSLLACGFCPPERGSLRRSYRSHTETFPDSGDRHRWCVRGEFSASAASAAARTLRAGDCPDDGCRRDHLRRQDLEWALAGPPGDRALLVGRPEPCGSHVVADRANRLAGRLERRGWHRAALVLVYCFLVVLVVRPGERLWPAARLESGQERL